VELPGGCLAADRDPGRRRDGQHDAHPGPAAGFGLAGTAALDAFFYLATIGALCLLVVYVLVSVSALRLLAQDRGPVRGVRVPGVLKPSAILPIGGAAAALYVLYRNLIPAPAYPYDLFPYLAAGWLVLGLTVSAAVPQLRRRVSEGLALR
jgi:amino acid transporter